MADQTYEQLFKRLLLHAPGLSPQLAGEFINTAYSRALGLHDWSALRGRADVFIPAPYATGTIDLTLGSPTMTGTGTAWTSAHEGWQLKIAGQAYFDVVSVDSPTQITLSRAWAMDSVTGSEYSLSLTIVNTPSDFLHFISFVDPQNNWKLHQGFLPEEIDSWDAERTSSGTPFLVVPAGVTSGFATIASGLRRFELWPRAAGAHTYSYTYYRKPALMSAFSDRPIWPLRGDAIRAGALTELCKWPGTSQTPNPHFSLELSQVYQTDFDREIGRCAREDQEVAATDITYNDPFHGLMFAPLDARYLQSHDVVVG
jgi:hypothetical protein